MDRMVKIAAFVTAIAGVSSGVHAQSETSCTPLDGPAAIVLNQTGVERLGPKTAILRADADTPQEYWVRDHIDAIVQWGETQPRGFDESSGDTVHVIDFSAVGAFGSGYWIESCGARSRRFSTDGPPYGQIAEDSLRYFYLNRLGIDLEPEFTGGEAWARAGGFMDSSATCFTGEDMTGTTWPGCDYTLDTTGGWADAGDYGQYMVNGGVSVWTLQYAYERLQTRSELEALGWNGERVPLPETTEGVSEILLESRWALEFFLGLQIPDGEHVWVDGREVGADLPEPVQIDGSGLVHHKHHERAWLPLPLIPADANEPRYLYPPSTAATLNLAAIGAQCARLWRDIDQDFADQCLSAAERAYEAAKRHPDLFAHNLFDGGGAYGDVFVGDEFFWAATELFLTTGDESYAVEAQAYRADFNNWRSIFWASTEQLGLLSAALHSERQDSFEHARTVLLEVANAYRAEMEETAYLYPLPPTSISWGSSSGILNRALILAAAHDLNPEAGYRTGVVNAMDYLLGRNPLDQSYIAGYGERAMRHPHHRFWAEGADPAFPPAPPGALSGGPNNRLMTDSIAREMEGTCAAQTCWVDHVDAFTMNEVAINWNAPLFAISAWLEATKQDAP